MVLSVFVDGLKITSLQHMPFLNSLCSKRRLKTDLGYSVTCHATMYSGVYPNKHRLWFLWKYQPETSPFKWLPDGQLLDWVNGLPARYFVGKMTRLFSQNSSYGGLSVMKRSALRNWKYFDLAENKLWNEEGYIEGYPTIFDILREYNVEYQAVGLTDSRNKGGALKYIEEYEVPSTIPQWLYLFIGELDHVSHFHGQDSPEAREVLLRIDKQIERIYLGVKDRLGREPFFLCWSDHGHMRIKKQYDIYKHFEERGADLDRFIHIVDTNFARFWFRNDAEFATVQGILSDMPSGFVLNREHLLKYHTEMPDRRYGDIIFYLDHPYMFKKTVWGYGLRTISIHGYLPDYEEKDGVFISNMVVRKEEKIALVDILPSLLTLLEIKTGAQFDGSSVWT